MADKLVLMLAGNLVPPHTELLGLPKSMVPGLQENKVGVHGILMTWPQESHSITSFVLCWLQWSQSPAQIDLSLATYMLFEFFVISFSLL